MSIRNFTEDEIKAYSLFGSDYLSLLEAMRNKFNAKLEDYLDLAEAVVTADAVTDVPNVTIPYDQTLINARLLYNSINRGDDEVMGIDGNLYQVSDVADSMHDQINAAKATICAFDSLGEGQQTGGDVITLLQSKFEGASIDKSSINVYQATITSILSNAKLNVYQKAQALMSYIKPTNHSGAYYPVDVEFTTKTPFHIFFGDISINYSNFITYMVSAFAFNFKMEAAICKMVWHTGKNIWNSISKWFKRNYTQGTRIDLINQDAYPIADGFGKVEDTEMDSWTELKPWFDDHLPYGVFIQINIPGGILLLERVVKQNQYDEDYDVLRVWYRPVLTNFILDMVSQNLGDPTIGTSITSFQDLLDKIDDGTILSDYMDFSPVDLDWSNSSTNTIAAKGFALASWLSFEFLCALSNKDGIYGSLTNFDNWLNYSWTDASDMSAWKSMLCNSTTNSPLSQTNSETANTYTTRIMNLSNYEKFDRGLKGILYYIADGSRSNDNWCFTWITRADYPSPAYHLADATELRKQAANATTAIIIAVATVAVIVSIAKITSRLKDKVTLAQANIDKALFDDDLDLTKINQLRKNQKKVNIVSKMLGLPSDVVGNTVASGLFNAGYSDDRIQQIIDLIK